MARAACFIGLGGAPSPSPCTRVRHACSPVARLLPRGARPPPEDAGCWSARSPRRRMRTRGRVRRRHAPGMLGDTRLVRYVRRHAPECVYESLIRDSRPPLLAVRFIRLAPAVTFTTLRRHPPCRVEATAPERVLTERVLTYFQYPLGGHRAACRRVVHCGVVSLAWCGAAGTSA
jgi:hypothetical protein